MESTEQRRTIAVDLLHVVADEYERKLEQRAYYVRVSAQHGLKVGEIAAAARMTRSEVEAILRAEAA